MPDGIKRMSVKEFRELGYLQELNRRFLHPLGLTLEVIADLSSGEEKFGGIWDFRDHDKGIYFAVSDSVFTNDSRFSEFKKKAEFVEKQIQKRTPGRINALGFFIEPILEYRRPKNARNKGEKSE